MDFNEFWKLYPKKKGKVVAERSWAKIPPLMHEQVIAGLKAQIANDTQFQNYTPNPSTWLNQQRWDDEVVTREEKADGRFEKKPHRYSSAHDGQCQYRHEGRRCPFPGNVSDGMQDTWHCIWHSRADNRKGGPAQHNFFDTFAKNGTTVRETLEMWYGDSRPGETLMAEHPEWQRQDGEARSEYVARMKSLHKNLKGAA